MAGHTDNCVDIRAPLDLTWRMANDVERWPELFAGEYAAAQVLEREEGRVRFRLTTIPMDDGRAYSWTSERVLDRERGVVVARRIEPGPFLYMHIFQSFTETEIGTRLRWVQDFEMREDGPFNDQQMETRIDRSSKANLHRHKEVIEALAESRQEAG